MRGRTREKDRARKKGRGENERRAGYGRGEHRSIIGMFRFPFDAINVIYLRTSKCIHMEQVQFGSLHSLHLDSKYTWPDAV